jgi:DNA-binding NtrC family response regulator
LNINPPRIILVDGNKDIVSILAGIFGLNGYEVHKTYTVEECLNKVKDIEGIVDVIFVDGKVAADRAAMLIFNVNASIPRYPLWSLQKMKQTKQGFLCMVLTNLLQSQSALIL